MKRISALIALAVMSQAAAAHTKLSQSTPPNESVLDAAPAQFVLEYSEPVRLTAVSLSVAGDARALGPIPDRMQTRFVLEVPESLADGKYEIEWRAMSEDTHVMTGTLSFSIEPAAQSSSADTEGLSGAATASATK